MRSFIAADLPEEILQKIDKITAYFKTQIPSRSVKWVASHNLHLTVKFIGELPESKLPTAQSLIQEALKGVSPFTISLEGLGMFPNPSRPRVIWLGIQSGDPLVTIHKSLNQRLTDLGIKPENRDFHPHLTLGRVRRNVPRDAIEAIGENLFQFRVNSLGTALIDHLTLYESELTRQGPIYKSRFVVPFHQV